jgi:hypothetical protein
LQSLRAASVIGAVFAMRHPVMIHPDNVRRVDPAELEQPNLTQLK